MKFNQTLYRPRSDATAVSALRHIQSAREPGTPFPSGLCHRWKNTNELLVLEKKVLTLGAQTRPSGFREFSAKNGPWEGRYYQNRQFLRERMLKNRLPIAEQIFPANSRYSTVRAFTTIKKGVSA